MSELARLTQRLSVLLAAGVAPASAWRHAGRPLGEAGDPVALLVADGGEAERGLAAAWRVATLAGSPLAPSLARFAEALRALDDAAREARIALAGPVATARIVMVLPLVGLGFGALLGFDTLRTLFTTAPGVACLVAGVGLLLLGRRWNRALVARARPPAGLPGLELELLAIAVAGGGSLDGARRAVADALAACGVEAGDGASGQADEVLALSEAAGVPARALLLAEAEEQRREASAAAREAAARLAVRLMLPLGVCVLPAFLLLAVAPMVISLVSSTVAGF